jgi:hypothetical protein
MAKGFTLNVRCHGTQAYVPLTKNGEVDRIAVLLCQLKQDIAPQSVAYVRFPAANWSPHNTRIPHPPPPSAPKEFRALRHVLLSGEKLSIITGDGPKKLERNLSEDPIKNGDNRPLSDTPTRTDHNSLRWMPQLKVLAPDSGGVIKRAYVDPSVQQDPTKLEPPLVARFDIDNGRLETAGVERLRVAFKNQGQARFMPMAREALLQLQIEGDSFTLQSEPLSGGPPSAGNSMRFDTFGADTIDLVIGNEPPEDIYATTDPIQPIDTLAEDFTREFVVYTQLCETAPRDPLLPFISFRPGVHAFCSGAVYEPIEVTS